MQSRTFEEVVQTRRSIRRYCSEALSAEAVEALLEAGLRAPSTQNSHTTEFVLVEDKIVLEQLGAMKRHGGAFVGQAPLAIVLVANAIERRHWLEDASAVATQILLQAEALGLGACWCQVFESSTNDGRSCGEVVRELLDIPMQREPVCIISVGYKAEHPEPRAKKDLRWEQIHIGKYTSQEVRS